jgi:hypothetical protein
MIELMISADGVRYLTNSLRAQILTSDVKNREKCIKELEKIELIAKHMDEIITSMTVR